MPSAVLYREERIFGGSFGESQTGENKPTHNSEKDFPTIAGLTVGKEEKLLFGIVLKMVICKNSHWEVINSPCLVFCSSAAPKIIQAVSVILLMMQLGSVFVITF